jgi:translation initiation factor IF-2
MVEPMDQTVVGDEGAAHQELLLDEIMTVKDFADAMEQPVGAVITSLMKNGVMATLNENLDFDTMSIMAEEFGFTAQPKTSEVTSTPVRQKRVVSAQAQQSVRPPVVAVMGHVDHGKTSLLDAVRGSSVASGEAGGITQHISAYHVMYKDRPITFLDTPGHEAFAALRQHGAALTDVAIIVVAADDGVKPQTKEAIKYALSSGVRIIVALTKIDKAPPDLNRLKQQLVDEGLNPEDWGGDIVIVPVSAKTGEGIDQLLDMILLVVDIDELVAETDIPAEGVVIESHMAQGQGPVATLLIEHGALHIGEALVAGETYAKVRQLQDENGIATVEAGPSRAVTVSGFNAPPAFGDYFQVVANEKEARKLAAQQSIHRSTIPTHTVHSAQELLLHIDRSSQQKYLNVIIKADAIGSLESVTSSLESLGNEEARVKIVASGIGNISESDVSRAEATGATILAFHTTVSPNIKRMAHREGVAIKLYQVIYELLDDVKALLEGMLSPEIIETVQARLLVKGIFRQTPSRTICGGEVIEGKLIPGLLAQLQIEDGTLQEARVEKVQREQQEAKEILQGEMCGLELATDRKWVISEGDELVFLTRDTQRKQL